LGNTYFVIADEIAEKAARAKTEKSTEGGSEMHPQS
jgi:hypothetical protein